MLKVQIIEHHEDGTDFKAVIPDLNGARIEFTGRFKHYAGEPRASEWEPDSYVWVNRDGTMVDWQEVYLDLSAHSDGKDGIEVLDALITPFLDDNYSAWTEWDEKDARNAEKESQKNESEFQRSAGF